MAFQVKNPMPNEAIVYRSIPKKGNPPFWVVEQQRPSSAAFTDKTGQVSVNWAEYKPDPKDSVRPNSIAIVSLLVGDCRGCNKEVKHSPIQEGEPFGPNQAHAHICDPPNRSMSGEEKAIARNCLARNSKLVWMAPGELGFD